MADWSHVTTRAPAHEYAPGPRYSVQGGTVAPGWGNTASALPAGTRPPTVDGPLKRCAEAAVDPGPGRDLGAPEGERTGPWRLFSFDRPPLDRHREVMVGRIDVTDTDGPFPIGGEGDVVPEGGATPYPYAPRFYDRLRRDASERRRPARVEHEACVEHEVCGPRVEATVTVVDGPGALVTTAAGDHNFVQYVETLAVPASVTTYQIHNQSPVPVRMVKAQVV